MGSVDEAPYRVPKPHTATASPIHGLRLKSMVLRNTSDRPAPTVVEQLQVVGQLPGWAAGMTRAWGTQGAALSTGLHTGVGWEPKGRHGPTLKELRGPLVRHMADNSALSACGEGRVHALIHSLSHATNVY